MIDWYPLIKKTNMTGIFCEPLFYIFMAIGEVSSLLGLYDLSEFCLQISGFVVGFLLLMIFYFNI